MVLTVDLILVKVRRNVFFISPRGTCTKNLIVVLNTNVGVRKGIIMDHILNLLVWISARIIEEILIKNPANTNYTIYSYEGCL